MTIERYQKLLDDQREAVIHLAEEGNRLRKALMKIKELNDRRPRDATVSDIDDIIDEAMHGDCEKCSENGDPSCPYYGEPDGCNDREYMAREKGTNNEPDPDPKTNKFGVPYHVYRLLLNDGKEVYVDVGVEEEWGDIQPCLPDDCEDWRESVGLGNDSDGHRKIVRVVDEETGESLDPMKWARELVWPYAENYSS